MNMQNLKDNEILKYVETHAIPGGDSPAGLTTKEIATALGIWESDAAKALNRLIESQSLTKNGKRPIRYLPVPKESSSAHERLTSKHTAAKAFVQMIGCNGSLNLQTQLAKAAASYPPFGLHTLITGETGVGKSLMAEEIWRYYSEKRAETKGEIPFIVFNCAEYADNPQLLLAQLFGYEKGAFTDAKSDKEGLIEQANGGVLFLDEIHRLPATGQELFFTVIDKGTFRRMGSTEKRHVNVMIIGATTESPGSTLLNTFTRRIPIMIQIPPLSERPLKERLELIIYFFSFEAQRLHLPIHLSADALKLMMTYKAKANIGDLRKEIQLCCARSYFSYINSVDKSPYIFIDLYCLSRSISLGHKPSENIDGFFELCKLKNGITISPDGNKLDIPDYGPVEYKDYFASSCFIADDTFMSRESEARLPENQNSDEYYRHILSSNHLNPPGTNDVIGSISADIYHIAQNIIQMAQDEFGITYPSSFQKSIAYYLQQIRFFANAGRIMLEANSSSMIKQCQKEYQFVTKILPSVCSTLNIELTENEKVLLAMFFQQHSKEKRKHYLNIIIIAYGNSIASEIAQFVNQLFDTNIICAIDVSLDINYEKAFQLLCETVKQCNEGKGVIVLSDINSFIGTEDQVFEQTSVPVHILPYPSTVLTLETCKLILTSNYDIDAIASAVMDNYRNYLNAIIAKKKQKKLRTDVPQPPRSIIITYCITGLGSARMAQKLLMANPIVPMLADIVPLGSKDDLDKKVLQYGNRIKLVVGLIDPHIENIPFIGFESLLTQEGMNRVILFLDRFNTNATSTGPALSELSLESRLKVINSHIDCFAPSLPKEDTIKVVTKGLQNICKLYSFPLPVDTQVRLYIHLTAMLERMQGNIPLSLADDQTVFIHSNQGFFDRLKNCLNKACAMLQITLPDPEIYYVMITLPNEDITKDFW